MLAAISSVANIIYQCLFPTKRFGYKYGKSEVATDDSGRGALKAGMGGDDGSAKGGNNAAAAGNYGTSGA